MVYSCTILVFQQYFKTSISFLTTFYFHMLKIHKKNPHLFFFDFVLFSAFTANIELYIKVTSIAGKIKLCP